VRIEHVSDFHRYLPGGSVGLVRSTPGLTAALPTALPIHAGTDFSALTDFEEAGLRTAFLRLVSVLMSSDCAGAASLGKKRGKMAPRASALRCRKQHGEPRTSVCDPIS
jgi:hypothetical protein